MSEKSYISIGYNKDGSATITLKNVSLDVPLGGRRLIDDFSISLKPGDRFIMTGDSGTGKSSTIRAIRNLSNRGKGIIALPKNFKIMCMAQKVDLPRTTLRGILCSPKMEGAFTDEQMDEALAAVGGLDKLRNLLPLNQAKPDFLARLTEKYAGTASKYWAGDLAKLSETQRNKLQTAIAAYIEKNAENFFSEELKPYLTSAARKEAGEKIAANLRQATDEQHSFLGKPNLYSFERRIDKLAGTLGKYLLQGAAMDIRDISVDGAALSRILSGGEQQRIPFVQALLHKPDLLLMDEATASLDKKSGKKLYELVIQRLPNTIIWSVAHDPEVIQHHTLHGHLEDQKVTVVKVEQRTARSEAPAPAATAKLP